MVQISLPRIVRIGGGALGETVDALRQFGLERPLIVTDKYLVEAGLLGRLLSFLEEAGIEASIFDETLPDPTTGVVAAAVERLRDADRDCVIGFGGGSPIDTAKAVAGLGARGGRAEDFGAPAPYVLTDQRTYGPARITFLQT